MTDSKLKVIAVAWYREEDWPHWQSIDANLKLDYELWRSRMETKLQDAKKLGHRVEKIVIDPAEFLAWAHTANGGKIDSNARAHFAAMKAHDTRH